MIWLGWIKKVPNSNKLMDKISQIKASIASIVSLTEEELMVFCESFELKKLNKNEFFLKEGQICNYIGFVYQGVMIYFKSIDNGNEVTTDFAFEGDWVTVNQSRLNNTPSLINIRAIEHSELLVIKQQDLSVLYTEIPKIERLGRILMEQAYLKIVQQSIDLQVLTAKERYQNLLRKYPEIFQKVPLYHIANYLGIAPKSLSRIRKEIVD
jgi:CRP/FNR family transcriptional regulator, anaerobic regulatory protein